MNNLVKELKSIERIPSDDLNPEIQNHLILIERNLGRLEDSVSEQSFTNCNILLRSVKSKFEKRNEKDQEVHLIIPKIKTGKRGNNEYDIDLAKLEHYLSIGISVKRIAKEGLLGAKIHPNTIYNFMKRNNISSRNARFTMISDDSLKEKINQIRLRFPNSGIREVTSMLQISDPPIRVQRDRVAKLLSVVDPVGSARRWTQSITRRVYSVPQPNSLWHVDTHHKLIRFVLFFCLFVCLFFFFFCFLCFFYVACGNFY